MRSLTAFTLCLFSFQIAFPQHAVSGPFEVTVGEPFKTIEGRTWSCTVGEALVTLHSDPAHPERMTIQSFSTTTLLPQPAKEFELSKQTGILSFSRSGDKAVMFLFKYDRGFEGGQLLMRSFDLNMNALEAEARIVHQGKGGIVATSHYDHTTDISNTRPSGEVWGFVWRAMEYASDKDKRELLAPTRDKLSFLELVDEGGRPGLKNKWTMEIDPSQGIYSLTDLVIDRNGAISAINEPAESVKAGATNTPFGYVELPSSGKDKNEEPPHLELIRISAEGKLIDRHQISEGGRRAGKMLQLRGDVEGGLRLFGISKGADGGTSLYSALLLEASNELKESLIPLGQVLIEKEGKKGEERMAYLHGVIDDGNGGAVVLISENYFAEGYGPQDVGLIMARFDDRGELTWMKSVPRHSDSYGSIMFEQGHKYVMVYTTVSPDKENKKTADRSDLVYKAIEVDLTNGSVIDQPAFTLTELVEKAKDQTESWDHVYSIAPDAAMIEVTCKGSDSRWLRLKLR